MTRSTSGRGSVGRNCRAYGVSVSMKRRWPSAKTTSKASELLPEPLGPVTTQSLPCGTRHDTSFRLCSRACATVIASGRLRSSFVTRGALARRDDAPAVRPAAGAEVDDPVRLRDDGEVVLDDQHRRSALDERVERLDDLRRVLGVEPGARLVDDEDRPRGVAGERPRELEPLCLAARERRDRLAEREVAEPDADEGPEHPLDDVVAVVPRGEEKERLVDGHREHVGDVLARAAARDRHREHLRGEPLPLADGAEQHHVGQELHLDGLVALARARLAASLAGDVEGEVCRRQAPAPGLRLVREARPDPIPGLRVRRRVATRGAAER